MLILKNKNDKNDLENIENEQKKKYNKKKILHIHIQNIKMDGI